VTRQRTVFWIGLLIYAASFFLFAVRYSFSTAPAPGYKCALGALFFPWLEAQNLIQGAPPVTAVAYFSLLISGLINPIFLAAMILVLCERYDRAVAILRIVLLLMIPFCWIFFNYFHFYPREGHILWIIGMLLVLFSNELATSRRLSGGRV